MKYFVTGGTGFVGGRLVKRLREAGHDVVALVRDPARAAAIAASGATLVPGDVIDRASLRAMAGCDGLFHIAAWYKVGVRDCSPARLVNVEGTRNVLETMRDLGIRKGVYTSTLAVYSDTHGRLVDESYRFTGRHLTAYDETKAAAHYDVAMPLIRAGLPLVVVLPGPIYGPGDPSKVGATFVKFLQRKLGAIPRGVEYCWAHVDDVVTGHILAMERGRPGEEYIIAGPRHSLADAFAIAERITGAPAPRRQIPAWLLRMLARLMTPVAAIVPVSEDMHPETLRSLAGVTYLGDNAKACRELGYRPRSLEDGLRETLLFEMKRMGLPMPTGRT